MSYHCGSVWPHDTAIAVYGLLRAGWAGEATVLAQGLLAAADAFEDRLPELYGGFSEADVPVPVPYPVAGHRFAAGVESDGTPVLPTALPGLTVRTAGR